MNSNPTVNQEWDNLLFIMALNGKFSTPKDALPPNTFGWVGDDRAEVIKALPNRYLLVHLGTGSHHNKSIIRQSDFRPDRNAVFFRGSAPNFELVWVGDSATLDVERTWREEEVAS